MVQNAWQWKMEGEVPFGVVQVWMGSYKSCAKYGVQIFGDWSFVLHCYFSLLFSLAVDCLVYHNYLQRSF